MTAIDRRSLLLAGLLGLATDGRGALAAVAAPGTLPPWTPGMLDIHHIDTGVGNATFILGPDGTTILIDCGVTRGGPPASAPLRPDESRTPGQWVARYAQRHARAAQRTTLDYIVATHVHPDHIGSPEEGDPIGPDGVVRTGLPEVDSLMPADLVIDRGFPDYDPLPVMPFPFAANHVAWLKSRVAAGRRVERVAVGSTRQIRARQAGAFNVRMIGGGGRVWTGDGEGARDLLPPRASWTPQSTPEENCMSIAMVLAFGPFRYFAGGDLVANTRDGAYPWLDVETPIVRMAGKVDVASADHHGYYDAVGPDFTRVLDASAYVVQAWHATHPAQATLQRMLNAWPAQSLREVYITRLTPESRAVNKLFVPRLKSTEGHVVVRVSPDGAYRIYVTDSRDEMDTITFAGEPRISRLLST